MPDTAVALPPYRKRRRWLRALLWLFGIFVVLLVAVYFVGTSSAFLKGVLLPRVSKALNADIIVADATISPFTEVTLHDLKVKTTGDEPLVSVSEVRVRYSLMDIIHGNIKVDEVLLSSPTVVLVENADKSSNLDPILKSQKEKAKEAKTEQPSKPSKPVQIDLKKIALTEATVRKVKVYDSSHRDTTELAHVNITVEDVKNGQPGKVALNADIKSENNPPAPQTNSLLQAKLNGNFVFALNPDLRPASIKGSTRLEVTQAQGALAEVASLGTDLDCEVTPTEVKQVALRFQKGGTRLGEVRVSGPFDMEKVEGRLRAEILSIDKQVLNLAGARSGIDFGTTTINSTNDIELARGGSVITAIGRFNVAKFQVTRTNLTTPPLEFRADYNLTLDRATTNALIRQLSLTGMQKGTPLLKGELSNPMTIALGNAASAVGDSAFNMSVTGLELADWKPFLGESASAGTVNLKMKVLSQQAGKLLLFDLNSQIENLTAAIGTNRISQAALTLQANGKATAEPMQFNLSGYELKLSHQNEPVATVSGAGTYDLSTTNADMQLALKASVPRLLRILPQPDVSLASGTIDLKGHLIQRQTTQNLTGTLALADLTGKVGKNDFRGFSSTMELDLGKTPQELQIRRVAGSLDEGENAGGNFNLSGACDMRSNSSQLNARLINFNQNGLRPFLEPMLSDKKLVSVTLNANATTQYNPKGDSAVKADLSVTNLVVSDPKNQFPAKPLEARVQIDTSLKNQVADLRQFQIALTPTQRGANELRLTGKLDMSATNAAQQHLIQGNLKLAADSLDVTSYYDLFAGEKKTPEKKAAPGAALPPARTSSAPAPAPPDQEKEPEPKQLPFTNFVADLSIGRFYLREVEITNLQTTAKLNGGHAILSPVQLALNGAPVGANVDLDLGVPGYNYDCALKLQTVPLAPLVNSFQPERQGQIGGTMTLQTKVKGNGTTGASLKKNLTGDFDFASTNLNLAVVNVKSPLLKSIINVVGVLPELIRSPQNVGSLLLGATRGGLSSELSKSPIDTITAQGAIGSGKLDLKQALVQSSVFQARAKGEVALEDVLTNSSINIPVTVALKRSLAEQLNVASNVPTNVAYASLPPFLTMRGTVGKPETDINKLALAGTAARGILGAIPESVGGKAGGVLKGLGNLLPGATASPSNADTNPPAATQPATNRSTVNDLLDLFKKPKK